LPTSQRLHPKGEGQFGCVGLVTGVLLIDAGLGAILGFVVTPCVGLISGTALSSGFFSSFARQGHSGQLPVPDIGQLVVPVVVGQLEGQLIY
jgi:hypothetical protein